MTNQDGGILVTSLNELQVPSRIREVALFEDW